MGARTVSATTIAKTTAPTDVRGEDRMSCRTYSTETVLLAVAVVAAIVTVEP
jgi:hypothetical protein